MNSEMEIMVVHAAFEDVAKIVALVDIPVEIEDDSEALTTMSGVWRAMQMM